MLYAALWRALPGPPVAKALQALVLLAVVVAFCFLWLFPRIAPYMPFNDNTVSTQSEAGAPPGLPAVHPLPAVLGSHTLPAPPTHREPA